MLTQALLPINDFSPADAELFTHLMVFIGQKGKVQQLFSAKRESFSGLSVRCPARPRLLFELVHVIASRRPARYKAGCHGFLVRNKTRTRCPRSRSNLLVPRLDPAKLNFGAISPAVRIHYLTHPLFIML